MVSTPAQSVPRPTRGNENGADRGAGGVADSVERGGGSFLGSLRRGGGGPTSNSSSAAASLAARSFSGESNLMPTSTRGGGKKKFKAGMYTLSVSLSEIRDMSGLWVPQSEDPNKIIAIVSFGQQAETLRAKNISCTSTRGEGNVSIEFETKVAKFDFSKLAAAIEKRKPKASPASTGGADVSLEDGGAGSFAPSSLAAASLVAPTPTMECVDNTGSLGDGEGDEGDGKKRRRKKRRKKKKGGSEEEEGEEGEEEKKSRSKKPSPPTEGVASVPSAPQVHIQIYRKVGEVVKSICGGTVSVESERASKLLWYPAPLAPLHDSSMSSSQPATMRVSYRLTRDGDTALSSADFEVVRELGRGQFGVVLLVRRKVNGRLYALKVMKKAEILAQGEASHIMGERSFLAVIDHPFLTHLQFSFTSKSSLYLGMPYIGGGELFFHLQRARRFPVERARFYAAEILLALEYLHQRNILYRDLKPENILLDLEGHVILTDLGLCKELNSYGDRTHTFGGTAEYLAPEVVMGQGACRGTDWWTLGILLFEMLVGAPPFYDPDPQVMYDRIKMQPLRFPRGVERDSRELIMGLLDRNPLTRLGSARSDAEEIKNMPFFRAINWNSLALRQVQPPVLPAPPEDLANNKRAFNSSLRVPANLADMMGDDGGAAASTERMEDDAFNGFSFVGSGIQSVMPQSHIPSPSVARTFRN